MRPSKLDHELRPQPRAQAPLYGEFLKSAQRGGRTSKPVKNRLAPNSVLRELLKSAKGAARATKLDQELIAPPSVLRELLKETTPHL